MYPLYSFKNVSTMSWGYQTESLDCLTLITVYNWFIPFHIRNLTFFQYSLKLEKNKYIMWHCRHWWAVFLYWQIAKMSAQNAIVSEYTNMGLLETQRGKTNADSTIAQKVRVIFMRGKNSCIIWAFCSIQFAATALFMLVGTFYCNCNTSSHSSWSSTLSSTKLPLDVPISLTPFTQSLVVCRLS